jgi:hypothetical protein
MFVEFSYQVEGVRPAGSFKRLELQMLKLFPAKLLCVGGAIGQLPHSRYKRVIGRGLLLNVQVSEGVDGAERDRNHSAQSVVGEVQLGQGQGTQIGKTSREAVEAQVTVNSRSKGYGESPA